MNTFVPRFLLVHNNYDSVSNFVKLYDTFQRSRSPDLCGTFERYKPPIIRRKKTCVGLGMELVKRWCALDEQFPGFAHATTIVSCEEAVLGKIMVVINSCN